MERVCEHLQSLTRGHHLLLNNLWGAASGEGEQCLWAEDASPDGSLAWGTSWRWSGDPNTVKSYVSAMIGWHWGWPLAGGPLPVAIRDLRAVRADWDFGLKLETPSRLNVSYDIWLTSAPDPSPADLTDEVMIWLHREGGVTPIGERQGIVDLEHAAWELWEGPHPSGLWQVHSFVRVESARSASFDIAPFFAHLARKMPRAAYLVGIEAGPEVFTGAGRLETTRYSVVVERTAEPAAS